MKKRVKRLVGTSQASRTYNIHSGWVASHRKVEEGLRTIVPVPVNQPNPIQKFYHKFFHGSEAEYHDWRKERLTMEGCYDHRKE